jgi:2-polyprenyl-3-methyl-5-hydroxy-6-metoxy-1,4-benzoquinol methylase
MAELGMPAFSTRLPDRRHWAAQQQKRVSTKFKKWRQIEMDTTQAPAIDMNKLNAFIGQFVTDLGATVHTGMVVIGEKLGLYKALAGGPMTSAQLAAKTKTDERYLREWLASQAAGGYITYDDKTGKFSLSEEQVFTLATEDSPAYLPGAFELALGSLAAVPRITESFRTGDGMGWGEHVDGVFHGCEKFFRPGYAANLVSSWIPSLTGVKEKLDAGAQVADVGCGQGASTVLMAKAFPKSHFFGFDYHDKSIEAARESAKRNGVADRVTFDVAKAKEFPGRDYDFVAVFDCLHDMGDPVGAAAHVRQSLAKDGTWMIVEPFANDQLKDNLNPVGRVYYSFSTLLCTPCSRSQEVGLCLGAQAGEKRIREVVTSAGFNRFRRATETPFNIVYEARP